eukprot:6956245-Lingulodinium_polyedra.AAC.1
MFGAPAAGFGVASVVGRPLRVFLSMARERCGGPLFGRAACIAALPEAGGRPPCCLADGRFVRVRQV